MMKAFSLLDTKVGVFSAPFFFQHVGQATRAVQELGSDLRTQVGRHPADFVLYEIGTFDEETGVMEPAAMISHGPVVSFLPQERAASLFGDFAHSSAAEGFRSGGSQRAMEVK